LGERNAYANDKLPPVYISDTNLNTARLKVTWREKLGSHTKYKLMVTRQVVKM
jgi:hypothetical protein